jgi:transcriptional regulator with XRE-family HTH domain
MNGKVKKLREQRALSLSDLAQITGLSRVTINRIENGKQKPMPRTIRKLANALGVTVEELTSEQASFLNVAGNRQ